MPPALKSATLASDANAKVSLRAREKQGYGGSRGNRRVNSCDTESTAIVARAAQLLLLDVVVAIIVVIIVVAGAS